MALGPAALLPGREDSRPQVPARLRQVLQGEARVPTSPGWAWRGEKRALRLQVRNPNTECTVGLMGLWADGGGQSAVPASQETKVQALRWPEMAEGEETGPRKG